MSLPLDLPAQEFVMPHRFVYPTTLLFKLTLLSLPLLLAACSNSAPVPTDSGNAASSVLSATSTAHLEAEAGVNGTGEALTPQMAFETGAVTGSWIIQDSAASGGQSTALMSTGSAVRFTVPSTLAAGKYVVKVQARGESYNGSPILGMRIGGVEKTTQTISSPIYASFSFGTYSLSPGDVVELVFKNDLWGGTSNTDRNVYIDYLDLTSTTVSSAPIASSAPTVPTTAVDVRTLGVKGDGVTDDTAALNRVASLVTGKSIYFPAGIYLVSRPVVLNNLSNQQVVGSGAVIKATPSWVNDGGNMAILTLNNANDVLVKGLTIQGFANRNKDSWTNRMDGFSAIRGNNITVENVEARETQTVGINSENTTGFKVVDSRVYKAHGHGMGCGDCVNSTFSGNTIIGDADPNATTPNSYAGLGLMIQMGDTTLIENNIIRNIWDTATKTEGTSNVTYRGNTIDIYGKDGIKIMPFPPKGVNQVKNAVIEKNTVSGPRLWKWDGGGGAMLQGVDGGRVSGNKITGSPAAATRAGRPDTALVVNTYSATSKNITVEENTVTNSKVGMLLEPEYNTAVRRNVFSSQNRGMSNCINIGMGTGSIVEANTFIGFRDICTMVYGGSSSTIQNNSYSDGETGIYINGTTQTQYRFLKNGFAATVSKPFNISGIVTCSGNVGNVPVGCQ